MQKLLRFSIMSDVNDGKKTLINHLLSACQVSMQRESKLVASGLLIDNHLLQQQITYLHFQTPKSSFIIVDSLQYMHDLIMQASHYDLALIVLNAQKGITEKICVIFALHNSWEFQTL